MFSSIYIYLFILPRSVPSQWSVHLCGASPKYYYSVCMCMYVCI